MQNRACPGSVTTISLPSHKDLPDKTRPAFHARILTARQDAEMRQALFMDAPNKAVNEGPKAGLDATLEALAGVIVGWDNLPGGVVTKYQRKSNKEDKVHVQRVTELADALSSTELTELSYELIQAQSPSEDDRKKLESGSPSDGAASATGASPDAGA